MELFIQCVQRSPCLWDINSLSYRNTEKKEEEWARVVEQCGLISVKEAKIRWKKLRDSHREALRRRKIKIGTTCESSMRPWKYEQQMSFLLPYMAMKSHGLPDDMGSEAFAETSELESEMSEVSQLEEQTEMAPDQKEAYANSKAFFNMIRERESRQAAVDASRKRRRDALDDLFSSLCSKTKSLPKYLQLRVQREIFTAVSRAEEEAMLNEDSNIFIATHHTKSSPAPSLATDSP